MMHGRDIYIISMGRCERVVERERDRKKWGVGEYEQVSLLKERIGTISEPIECRKQETLC